MKRRKKGDSREVGLKIAWICGQYFLKLEHLHYGYWPDELEIDIGNLRSAQQEYVRFLSSHIPEGLKTILDVGCGAGRIAHKLLSMGYEVDCVSPSGFLAEQTRDIIGQQGEIFECRYEELQTQKRYDLILFVESFQYIDLQRAVANTSKFLNADGYMLICDIFKKDAEGKERQRGGHELNRFFRLIETYSFRLIEDVDITEQTAPSIDLLNDALEKVAEPVMDSIVTFLADRYPGPFKLLSWKYQNELEKIYNRYSGGDRSAENFKESKSYRLLLYRKSSS